MNCTTKGRKVGGQEAREENIYCNYNYFFVDNCNFTVINTMKVSTM